MSAPMTPPAIAPALEWDCCVVLSWSPTAACELDANADADADDPGKRVVDEPVTEVVVAATGSELALLVLPESELPEFSVSDAELATEEDAVLESLP